MNTVLIDKYFQNKNNNWKRTAKKISMAIQGIFTFPHLQIIWNLQSLKFYPFTHSFEIYNFFELETVFSHWPAATVPGESPTGCSHEDIFLVLYDFIMANASLQHKRCFHSSL